MDTNSKIAAVSTYGTISLTGKRYQAILLYEDFNDLVNKVKMFLCLQIKMASMIEEFKDDIYDINTSEVWEKIKEELKEEISLISEENNRLVIGVPEVFSDYHIEILGEIGEDKKWLLDSEEAGIMATDIPEGCGGRGEFLEVVQLVNPKENLLEEHDQGEDYETPIEKWDALVGEGVIVEIYK